MIHYPNDLTDGEIRLVFHHFNESDPSRFHLPTYYFRICDAEGATLGWCDLRIGHNLDSHFGGNIGYTIEEPHRGHHYAVKACRLLFELAKKHAMEYLLITCSPDNIASRKTCEYAGGRLLETAALPADSPIRAEGNTHACIFRFELTARKYNSPILLRSWNESDAPALLELHRDPELRKSGLPFFENAEDCARIIGYWSKDAHHKVILRAEGHSFAGYISLGDMNRYEGYMELEYAIVPHLRGHGFAADAIRQMLNLGFGRPEAEVVAAWVRSHNASSVRVLEKCGFTFEGRLRKHARDKSDTLCYSMLREEWAAHR